MTVVLKKLKDKYSKLWIMIWYGVYNMSFFFVKKACTKTLYLHVPFICLHQLFTLCKLISATQFISNDNLEGQEC